MKRIGKLCLCLAGGLVLNAGLRAGDAVSPGNPYAPIVTRNVFDIHPPPPVDPNQPPAEALPKITLNGFTSVLGHVRVLFKAAIPLRPGVPAKEQTYILSEGEQQDDIEVTKIDDQACVVTFNNHGTIQEVPLAVAKASGPAGALPPQGIPGLVPGPSFPGAKFAPGGGAVNNGIIRFGQGAGQGAGYGGANPNVAVGGNNPNGSAGGANNTVYSTFGNASAGSGSRFGVALGGAGNNLGSQPQNNTSPDDIQAIIAANHLHAIQSGNPTAPLFPPTKFDSQAGIPPSLMPGGSNVH